MRGLGSHETADPVTGSGFAIHSWYRILITYMRARSMNQLLKPFLLAIAYLVPEAHAADLISLRVMTLNLLHGGVRLGQPLSQSVKVINEAKADLVGVQETHAGTVNNAAIIAETLNWHHFDQGGRTSIISRHPIVGHTSRKWGVHIKLPSGRIIHAYNAHLRPAPYQPYQLASIPYGDYPFIKTEAEAVRWAKSARGDQVERLLSELKTSLKAGHICFLTGDLNEPSHQDWTAPVVTAGRIPIPVAYPTTRSIVAAGMLDGYRSAFPDPVKHPGWTWTPTTLPSDPKDRHDRIDYVFSNLPSKTIQQAAVVGESKARAKIVVKPWPTDHRAVVVEYRLPPKPE